MHYLWIYVFVYMIFFSLVFLSMRWHLCHLVSTNQPLLSMKLLRDTKRFVAIYMILCAIFVPFFLLT